jgi:hypothetical protein
MDLIWTSFTRSMAELLKSREILGDGVRKLHCGEAI